jgi:O-acetylhomoserine/O-acetylserine sulfhydrylase-like pyridoxal-dependent enzyme
MLWAAEQSPSNTVAFPFNNSRHGGSLLGIREFGNIYSRIINIE